MQATPASLSEDRPPEYTTPEGVLRSLRAQDRGLNDIIEHFEQNEPLFMQSLKDAITAYLRGDHTPLELIRTEICGRVVGMREAAGDLRGADFSDAATYLENQRGPCAKTLACKQTLLNALVVKLDEIRQGGRREASQD